VVEGFPTTFAERVTMSVGRNTTRNTPDVLRMVIPSEFAQVRRVQNAVIPHLQAHGFDEDGIFAIKLALEEALINAIKHGNRMDATKTVTFESSVDNDRAVFAVGDQGPGFRRSDIPDPTAEENLEKSSGRGILLIESYMHGVTFEDEGRRIRMTRFNRPSN
jgi:serine/threonine-protein kinase RsbW